MDLTDSLVVIVKPNGWLLCTFDGPRSDSFPCVCAQLVVFESVARQHLVVGLDHLRIRWET